MTPRLLLNSTKAKDYARNAREKMRDVWCVCVSYSPPPLVFIAGRHRVKPSQPTQGANGETPHALVEAVGPTGQVGRPGRLVGLPGPPTAPNFFWQAVWSLLV